MSYTENHLVEVYTGLLESLSAESKAAIIKRLSNSVTSEEETKEAKFYSSFGAFASDKSAEEIIKEIKTSRKFGNKEIKLDGLSS